MADKDDDSNGSGVGFLGLLTIVFIALKLIPHGDHHIIDWSWWWVLAPIWLPIAAALLVVGLGLLILGQRGKK